MWSPTHVQVVVQRARNLPIKGKNGTNDAFVTIQLGKEKYQTSVKEKSDTPEWNEECELTIPDGNTSYIALSVLHRNFVGLDKFLGQTQIPLNELDVYERAKSRWYPLENKPGKPATKVRGELEVRISFIVKSVTGSLMDLSKKTSKKTGSLPSKMVHSVGGSLMNLASKEKKHTQLAFKNIANYGHKLSEKFPLSKKSSKSAKAADGRIEERESEPEHDEDNLSHGFESDDEQFNFGIEQLSDDFVIPASDYAPDSPLARHPMNHHGGEVAQPALDRTPAATQHHAVEKVSQPSAPEKRMAPQPPPPQDEWQAKLLGSQMPTETERRRSVPILPQLPLLQESPLEAQEDESSPLREALPPPPRKMKIERNNIRRHTVDAVALSKMLPDPPKTAPPKPPPPKLKPELTTTPQDPSDMTNPFITQSARQHAPPPPTSQTQQSNATNKTTTQNSTTTAPVPTITVTGSARHPNANNKTTPTKKMQPSEVSKVLANLPKEKAEMFEKMSKEDLVELIVCQQSSIDKHLKQIRDLEEYIDSLLVRVMETTPRILQNPYKFSPSIRKLLSSAQERAWP